MSATWDSEELIIDGDTWVARLIEAMDAAEESIDVELYILNADGTGRSVVAALRRAAERGVIVRLLVDGIGSSAFVWSMVPDLYASPILVRVYHPAPGQVLSPVFRQGSRLASMLRLIPRLNRRNHRKLILIDARIAFVGSFNIGDFIRPSQSPDYWREIGVRVEGAGIPELVEAFANSWQRSWSFHRRGLPQRRLWPMPRKPIHGSGLVMLNHRLRLRVAMQRHLLERIAAAERRIWIAAAYFVPSNRLISALSAAAERGVDVRLLMSQRSDIRFMPWAAAAFWQSLLRAGVRVDAYRPGIVHAKAVLIDDWLRIGSSNLNQRSLLHDLEADVIVSAPSSLSAFADIFRAGLDQSEAVTTATYQAWPWQWRLLGRVALVMRRFL